MISIDVDGSTDYGLLIRLSPPHEMVKPILLALNLAKHEADVEGDRWLLPAVQFPYFKKELDVRKIFDGRDISDAAFTRIQPFDVAVEQRSSAQPPPPLEPGPRNYLPGGVEKEFLALSFQQPTPSRLYTLKHTKAQWLQTPAYQWLLDDKTISFMQQYNKLPPHDWIWERLQKEKGGSEYIEYATSICALFNHVLTRAEDAEIKFINHVTMYNVTDGYKEAYDGFKNTESAGLVIEHMDGVLQKARYIYTRPEIYDYTSLFETRREKRIARKDNPKDFRLKLGIPMLDTQLKVVPGSVTGFLAPFGRYKSVVLGHIVWTAAIQGLSVALFNFENPLDMVAARLDSRFTFVDYEKIATSDLTPEIDDKMREFMSWIATRMPNRVKIIPCKPKETSVNDCNARLQEAYHDCNFNPSVVVFDYANLIGVNVPKNVRWEERQVQEQVVWDLQSLSKGRLPGTGDQRAVVTAFQTNMQGVEADRIKKVHMGKSIGIPQSLDTLIAINQDKSEAQDKMIVFSILKSRDSAITQEDVKVKHEIWRMNIAEDSTTFWQNLLYDNKVG